MRQWCKDLPSNSHKLEGWCRVLMVVQLPHSEYKHKNHIWQKQNIYYIDKCQGQKKKEKQNMLYQLSTNRKHHVAHNSRQTKNNSSQLKTHYSYHTNNVLSQFLVYSFFPSIQPVIFWRVYNHIWSSRIHSNNDLACLGSISKQILISKKYIC